MEIAGHKDMRMFLRYNHTNKDAKRKAINKLENHLKSYNIGTYTGTSAKFENNSLSN